MKISRHIFLPVLIILLICSSCVKKRFDYSLYVPEVEYSDGELEKHPDGGDIKIMSFNVRYGTANESDKGTIGQTGKPPVSP